MKKRTLRRCMAEEIREDFLGQITGGIALRQIDPEDDYVPTYDEHGVEID